MTTDTEALIEALERAEGPSKETDRQIARLAGWHRVEPRHTRGKHGGWIAPQDWLGANSDGSPIFDSLHGTTIHRDVPDFTASVDAALTLVPEGWHVHSLRQDYGRWTACLHRAFGSHTADNAVWRKGHHWPPEYMVNGETLTPALALCIAALRARKEQP